MGLFILAETSAGYALFKAKDKKLLKSETLAEDISSVHGAVSALKLKKFMKFESAATGLNEVAALIDGKVTPMLTSLLNELKDETKGSLAVADPKLGNAISNLPGLSIKPVADSSTQEIYRAIREHIASLIPDMAAEANGANLGLAHSLSRYKLKFSPDKVDTMIVQAIGSLDVMDKQLNTYAMRVKEWYGWHFPELAKILNDNLAYARVVLTMGFRSNSRKADLSSILPEEIEAAVKAAAEISMGTEITDEDMDTITTLAEQVVDLSEYRQQLSSYLTTRMHALAPNLTALVGELVGARLIAHAGSLMNLAKAPGSTIQILGAEKALFRALKTKHDTPKYGLIYHASLIGQATGKNKGKIARMLASKTALGLRIDALSDWGISSESTKDEPAEEEKSAMGRDAKLRIERRLKALEGKPLKSLVNANQTPLAGQKKWEVKEARKYNPDADGLTGDEPAAKKAKTAMTNGVAPKNKLVQEVDSEDDEMVDADAGAQETESEDEEKAPEAKADMKAAKKAEKEAKKARKAERAAKREAKAAKKAAKEAKKSERDNKKRKHDDEGEKVEKKKKKKSKE
ncbi:Nop domain-containing protein [Lindgomyces ingoldianus]|uniref:Nop domain-containing protein n=1 Tax=Lindgomyces ingoldianus TaxID=673940 RepID=A0ACB6R895_9PLEO|nr:Nop domain-containing protein [Lindgomyces ingoldianus]KAF2475484.1 Nop domain-containing protein [Lindgomyces ingoldianus]